MTEPFQFPAPGGRHNDSGQVVPDAAMRVLLLQSASFLKRSKVVGEFDEATLHVQEYIWWECCAGMAWVERNRLFRLMCDEGVPLPTYREEAPRGGIVVDARRMTWDEFTAWWQAQDAAE